MEQYAIYLRKSRADVEKEEKEDIDVLKRHEQILLELARQQNLNIVDIYREVVSGDSIAARPKMQDLLNAVDQEMYDGVLVVDVDRLARGDTMDQGRVAQSFKYSDTKIITPLKTYDPNDEYDEEYFEFGLYMSRREYKIINRRLQRGRIAAVKEGKFVGNRAPYGYERVKLVGDRGFTLKPIPEQADVVRMIFDLYTHGEKNEDGSYKRLGISLIVRKLNYLKIPPQINTDWTLASVRDILINPTYIGKVRWNWRKSIKKIENGVVVKSRPRAKQNEYILINGLHDPIISEETFALAQEIISTNPPRPLKDRSTLKNPLAGLVICKKCGRHMIRRPYTNKDYPDALMCPAPSCNNVSSALSLVEDRILETLKGWVDDYKMHWEQERPRLDNSRVQIKQKAIAKIQNEIHDLEIQRGKIYDLFERSIYDSETFLERIRDIGNRINQAQDALIQLEHELSVEERQQEYQHSFIPRIEKILSVYNHLPNAQAKNEMLRTIISKVYYLKTKKGNRGNVAPDNFEIEIFPVVPKK